MAQDLFARCRTKFASFLHRFDSSRWLSCKRVGLFNNNKAISIDTHYTSVCTLKRTQRRTGGAAACVVTLGLYAISLPVGMISETGSLAALYNAIIPHAN